MTPEDLTLWAHIAAGFVALFAGAGALATRKGGRRHRLAGRAYVYAMAFVSGSALVLFAFERSFTRQFLSAIAVFSFYFAFSGYRVLSRKRPADGVAPTDWAALALFALASLAILVFGASLALGGGGFAPVLLVFGGIGVVFTVLDLREFREPPDPGAWLGQHATRMGAGYIAAVSAFSAVNFLFLPTVLRWLWPTLVGTPLLLYLQRRYEPGGRAA